MACGNATVRSGVVSVALVLCSGAAANITIDWTNKATSGFNAAEKTVVDAAITCWQDLIVNQSANGPAKFTVNITKKATAQIGVAYNFAQNANNIPTSCDLDIDDGTNVNGIGGFFVDPTPADSSEFTPTAQKYYGKAKASTAANGKIDLLNVVIHELGHGLGFAGNAGNNYSLWAGAHGGTTTLTYAVGKTATLFSNANFDGLAHLKNNAAQPNDLMATAGDLATNGIGDRRVPSQLDIDILNGIYSYKVDATMLKMVPTPGAGMVFAAGVVAGLRRRRATAR